MERLAQLAQQRDIDLRVDHRVCDVIVDDAGAVVGVSAQTPEGLVTLNARRAVVFATGGYPHNPALIAQHFATRMFGACAVSRRAEISFRSHDRLAPSSATWAAAGGPSTRSR